MLLSASAILGGLAAGFSLRWHWWRLRRAGIPILMYHGVSRHLRGSRLNRWRVTPEDFSRQMAHLLARGRQGVTLGEALGALGGPNGRVVALTFDDGLESVLAAAAPILQAHRFRATIYVVSARVGQTNDWDARDFGEPPEHLLDSGALRTLRGLGWEIGSHGRTHRALTRLSDRDLEDEVAGSRDELSRLVGEDVTAFCYPYGDFDDRVVQSVRRAGYTSATVIKQGIGRDLSDRFRLRRVVVRGTDPFLDFRLALTRGRSKW